MWGPRGPTVFCPPAISPAAFIFGRNLRPLEVLEALARSPPQHVIDDENPRISTSSETLRDVEG